MKGRVLVIGGTGHTGSYLVPRLVSSGYQVFVYARGTTQPYPYSPLWKRVTFISGNREEDEGKGILQEHIRAVKPDAIVDLIAFEPESAQALLEVLRGSDVHLLVCTTAWVYGKTRIIPTPEDAPRFPENDYARKKVEIEDILFAAWKAGKIRITVIRPTHITGPGKTFVTPFGDHDPGCLQRILNGEEIILLDGGFSTLHHVHPQDVAELFFAALENPRASVGEAFNCGARYAMTFFGLGEFIATSFGKPFRFRSMPLEEYTERFGYPEEAALHVRQGCCVLMQKAWELLGFVPRYTPEGAVLEAMYDLIARGILEVK
ncbi:NAD-dependent epimerase/dehydratase family protein [Candidatus Caldatribacterium saccharofermentans]|uniref:NAD-dependent epimerase/dehydratase family protein n=1 Tax=Candidatus Caldatribacterium saccharofermentans TaxID=1454753 RepID=UPI003D027F8F